MARLSRYLLRLFSAEAMALFGVAAFLLFLIQCLRLFDIVSDKGQNFLAFLAQAALGMPALGILFLYVCLGIGLGRALRNLEASSELQIIHVSGLLPGLLRAIGWYALAGTALVLLLAHVVDPLSARAANAWTASIAADLVSRGMIPHRFVETVPGVQMVIGDRDGVGNIRDFFADDRRDAGSRRTYFARSAIITRDEKGFVLRLQKGALQYFRDGGRFSQISFDNYDLPLDDLTRAGAVADTRGQSSSIELIADGLASGQWDEASVRALLKRTGEGLRVIAICLLVTAIAAFPNGRRRRFEVPVELAVLGAAFFERSISSYLPGPGLLGVASGSLVLMGLAAVILAVRLRLFRPVLRARAPA